MGDNFNDKFKQITELLGNENVRENLASVLGSLITNDKNSDTSMDAKKNEGDDNLEMLKKVRSFMDNINGSSDSRVNLLKSIKPFMNSKRQSKINNCIMLMQLSGAAKLLENTKEQESITP